MRVLVNGISLNYEEKGQGEPVVLLHGLGSNLTAWAEQMAALATRYRAIALDLRGHGESDKPVGDYHLPVLSHDLYRFLRTLGIAEAVIVGQSLGGMVAQRFALDHGDMVRALVISDSAARLPDAPRAEMLERARLAETEGMAGVLDLAVATALSPAFVASHPDFVAAFRARTLANDAAVHAAGARLVASVNCVEELPLLSCPTLVLVGDQDVLTPPEAAREMVKSMPAASLVVLPNAGHAAYLEQPEAYNRAVLDFLARL